MGWEFGEGSAEELSPVPEVSDGACGSEDSPRRSFVLWKSGPSVLLFLFSSPLLPNFDVSCPRASPCGLVSHNMVASG